MIAACFTPTDPVSYSYRLFFCFTNFLFQVLANSIVQGKFAEKHVPTHVRHIISCER